MYLSPGQQFPAAHLQHPQDTLPCICDIKYTYGGPYRMHVIQGRCGNTPAGHTGVCAGDPHPPKRTTFICMYIHTQLRTAGMDPQRDQAGRLGHPLHVKGRVIHRLVDVLDQPRRLRTCTRTTHGDGGSSTLLLLFRLAHASSHCCRTPPPLVSLAVTAATVPAPLLPVPAAFWTRRCRGGGHGFGLGLACVGSIDRSV